MSIEHKNVIRNNDEYVCTHCRKCWSADDRDPPECTEVPNPLSEMDAAQQVLMSGEAFFAVGGPVRHQSGPFRNIQNLPRLINGPGSETIDAKIKEWRENNPLITAIDFSELERKYIAQFTDAGLWPTPTSPMSAWLVFDAEDPKVALLVYAMTSRNATQFVNKVLKLYGTLQAKRCAPLDGEARGLSPYCDANPTNRAKAGKVARLEVISLLDWQKRG